MKCLKAGGVLLSRESSTQSRQASGPSKENQANETSSTLIFLKATSKTSTHSPESGVGFTLPELPIRTSRTDPLQGKAASIRSIREEFRSGPIDGCKAHRKSD